MPSPVYLTKSRYTAGLQCSRRLWLGVHEPIDWEEAEPGSAQDVGIKIGEMARRLFPGGKLIAERPWEHAKAVARTAELMADRSVPAIFEAAFEHSGTRIRVDVLERRMRGYWGLCEVKSSGEVKDYHYDDVALQAHVLRKAGIRLSSVELLHVNKDYVLRTKEVSWPKFFRRVDVRRDIDQHLDGIDARIGAQHRLLSRSTAPAIEPDTHCHAPVSCEHWERCTKAKPADWIFHMPNLSAKSRAELKALGIESIAAIPEAFKLSSRQVVVRDVTRSGNPFVADDLSERLRGFGPPAYYLDFEAFMPAVPLYCGTRPYQTVPFQWSLHYVGSGGESSHQEFLADGKDDPRRAFVESLIRALKRSKEPIIVYSSYEKSRLNELAIQFRDLAPGINRIIARLADLLPIVRSSIYHPGFEFSNSIKTVAHALCPDVSYDDLGDLADGNAASNAYARIASGEIDEKTCNRLRHSLLAYCKRDTWAMVRLHQQLSWLAKKTKPRAASK